MAETPQQRTLSLVQQVWERNRPQILQRLAVLEQAAQAATAHELTPELQVEATEIAHKLAGSLGMFGFPEGTRIARAIEQQLYTVAPEPAILAELSSRLNQSIFPRQA